MNIDEMFGVLFSIGFGFGSNQSINSPESEETNITIQSGFPTTPRENQNDISLLNL